MFGYARDELVGQPIDLLVPERLRARHRTTSRASTPRRGCGRWAPGSSCSAAAATAASSRSRSACRRSSTAASAWSSPGSATSPIAAQIEREAKRANAYLVSAVDAIQDAFALFDEDDRVVLVNSACRQLLGGSLAGAIIGRRFDEVLPDALAAGVFDFSDETREALLERWLAYHQRTVGHARGAHRPRPLPARDRPQDAGARHGLADGRRHRRRAPRGRAAQRERGEERVPVVDEPRAAHAAQRGPRVRAAARARSQAAADRAPAGAAAARAARRRAPAAVDRRRARSVADRGRADRDLVRAGRRARGARPRS